MFPVSNMDKATLLGWSSPPWTSCPHQAVAHFISEYRYSPTYLIARPSRLNQTQKSSKLIISSTSRRPQGISEWKHLLRWSQAPSTAGGLGNCPFSLPGCQDSRSGCNIVISQVLLVRPLWKKKRPLLGLCSLLEQRALLSSPWPGTARRAVFPLRPE